VEYVFQWITAAKPSIQNDEVILKQNGKSIQLKIEIQNSKIKPEIFIEDVSQSKAIQDSDNPGVSRIVIKVHSPSKCKSVLTITAIPLP
jgi:DNA-binding protein